MQRKIICLLSLMAVLLLFGKVYSQIDMWKIQFSYNLSEGKKGQAGIETDGKFLYTSKFSTDTFCKYDLKGSFKEFFTIDSVSLIRDLAFDGKYFYGGNIDTVIYQMDFDAKKLINKIYCHNLKVRHIAYDSVRDAFWVGNSSSDIYLVTRNGAIIDTISQKVHGLRSIYGSAYDYITAGGPYLWLFDQSGKGANLVAIRLKNGIKENTGIIHDVIGDISYKMTNPLAGGLFIAKNIVDNTTTIGGLIQTQPDIAFGYDLATLLYKSDIGIQKVINPSNEYSCQLTSNEKISIRVTNSGLDTITNFIAGYILNNKDTVTSNVNYKIAPGENYDVFFPDRDLSGKQYYNFHFYILLQNDLNKKNDTLNYKISTSDSKITVNLLTDKYSDETSWGIINSETNEIIDYISGLYPNTFYKTNVCVADDQCYNFVFLDSYGDGLISPGFYSVYYNDKLVGYDSSFSKKKDVIYNIGKCKANDASISIYTMGKIPLEAGSPHTVAAIVRNAGTNEINNLPVTLNVSGANIFSDVKTITSLKPLENDTIYFSPYTLLNKGNNVVKVYLPVDEKVVNDTAKYLQIVNDNTFNYADTSQSGTGLGVGFGLKSGVLLARYFVKGMKLVSDVNINISSENTVGKNFVAVVLDSKHNLIGTSDVYKVNESDVNKYVNFKIIYPPFINNSDIYVGLAQGEDTIPVYPLNAQYENPGRWSAFYSCDIRLNNFAQQNTFNRWMIEAVLKEPNDYDLSLVDITEPETSCSLGQSEKVSVKIINQGYKQVANTPIGILINNVFTRDTIFKTINPGDTISYTFNHTFDFSKEGDYNVKVFSILSSDQNHANDTISSMLTHVAYAKLPYSLGFEPSENTDGWSVYDENGDGYTWGIVKEDALTGSYSVRYSYNYEDTTIAADDWLVSTCFRLFPKNNYKLTFWYKCGDTLYPEKLIVAMGKNPVPSQLTIPLKVIDTIINTEYKRAIISFTVPDDDIYYFGWKAASQPNRWRLMLDSIQIFQDTATYVSTIFNRDSYIIIYPNPANDKFYINSTDKLNCLKVYNNIGELVFCQKPDKKYSEINTSSLKTGIYFINIESLNGIVNRKVSVIH